MSNPTSSIPTQTNSYTAIMGMGKTGVSCVHFLVKQGIQLYIMDNRAEPPYFNTLQQTYPQLTYLTGHFDPDILANAQEIIISPGISLENEALQLARQAGVPIIGDIELFARHVTAPVVGITGSNGKSTVTTMLGEMAKQAGRAVQVGGNLGQPALDLLSTAADLYVLELSSFQLETTHSLRPKVAVVLNVCADHLDRYADMQAYAVAKQRIYQYAETCVLNADDPIVMAMAPTDKPIITFSLQADKGDFRVATYQGQAHLVRVKQGQIIPLIATAELALKSAFMRANALAALALGEVLGLPLDSMILILKTFKGLHHRCELVTTINQVEWFNDSKGTNIGASIAAIQGLENPKKIILIAGGDGKGADFSPLAAVAHEHLKACVLIGRDAPLIEIALQGIIPLSHAHSLEAAVKQCAELADAGDIVLLSPACASLDMFKNYEHRGQVFTDAVHGLV
ncbi:UDP-N-acetylmuramoyl-L-alanine--D-glutamate ligase [Beggiatoa leptomitoformis]|uniref:UDP-N-acetylmuramoylalanine--D-glutamate ligase n=1 Tax=Beggiatoa leptomitoformis TaxID=288004 RepID=A0A2N9YJ36_9GAMM|nr:UDP-N-acetylmuramoyl-L-alanine--D-glutamate ligase [Beggiatoa leptomitoformis]ALG69320.1 UDP-N-acetylmuramoyl-L-alanine--D-glutamate ligase [Beggiatoa leptomitoformis]AUI70493.1 UDP-N-acetylmuramoyl-L-alanine--D-glutamate ligase [Beggiatoa leptomitoformis]